MNLALTKLRNKSVVEGGTLIPGNNLIEESIPGDPWFPNPPEK